MIDIFLENKYNKWYYQIINRSKNRQIDGYTEKHHIIPKSMGGVNAKSNLAILTAREHFICHWLLTKMTVGVYKAKMIYGLCCIVQQKNSFQQERYKLTARKYEQIRSLISQNLKTRIFSDEYRKKLRESAPRKPRTDEVKRKISETKKGVRRSEETIAKLRGRKFSAASREKMSIAARGRIPWNKGKKNIIPD